MVKNIMKNKKVNFKKIAKIVKKNVKSAVKIVNKKTVAKLAKTVNAVVNAKTAKKLVGKLKKINAGVKKVNKSNTGINVKIQKLLSSFKVLVSKAASSPKKGIL